MLFDPDFKNPCLEAALTYAELGFSAFPAKPGEKKGFKSKATSNGNPWGATKDADEIKKLEIDHLAAVILGKLEDFLRTHKHSPLLE